MNYTIQVSDHPEAGRRITTAEGEKSWRTVYDGLLTAQEARKEVDELSNTHRHVRAFKGFHIGKLWYGVFR